MDRFWFAAIGALIGFVSSLTVLVFKETFDRRRQRRTAINTLVLMVSSLRKNLDVQPDRVPHVHLDKMMSVLHDLAAREDLRRAYANYDQALREYRAAWLDGSKPTAAARESVEKCLTASGAILEKYKDGQVSRTLDRLAGVAD
ncbi:hypothetical protein [Bradyrhizobium sp. NBAIM01]|uniref:hypothetical protein n=1 Tax=Bradyrhizobium sp. NBAIM01 TaxID=2793818 RepID=UPI001CD480AA|nr:hypothetical protein [Bradyrhizobium sp. NBAIM01]MCA1510541.1 hypothetical protein [Bradyrhizobium sp. NBAIM01]